MIKKNKINGREKKKSSQKNQKMKTIEIKILRNKTEIKKKQKNKKNKNKTNIYMCQLSATILFSISIIGGVCIAFF